MSEPYWSALGARAGAGGVDYKGAWAAGTPYLQGDVVRQNGVDYLAVNPSTGVNPGLATGIAPSVGIGTSLPGSPVDGQEYVLVDSLTVPTWSWLFRYVASITDAYKWVFIGGVAYSSVHESIEVFGNAAVWLGPLGPGFVVPRTGIYDLEHTSVQRSGGAGPHYFRFTYSDPNGPVAGAREHRQDTQAGNAYWVVFSRDRLTLDVGRNLAIEFKADPSGTNYQRQMWAQPVRVA